MSKFSHRSLNSNQDGLVAIIVTMLIMIILSLIVLGFAQITRREQEQSIDRQLSTQAFYAAETGINDVVEVLKNASVAESASHVTDCGQFKIDAGLVAKSQLSGADVSYSCLLVDQTPTNLEYTNIAANQSEIIPIQRKTPATNVGSIEIQWEDSGGNAGTECPTVGTFPAVWDSTPASPATSCGPAILRTELVSFGPTVSRAQLDTTNRHINYLFPNFAGGVGSVTFASAVNSQNQGAITSSRCVASPSDRDCSMQITGINETRAYLRILPIYRSASVKICVPNCGSPEELTGAQASIDVTGRAQDVLRRIQVRVPTRGDDIFPEYAVQTLKTFCKRVGITPPSTAFLSDPPGGWIGTESSDCQPN